MKLNRVKQISIVMAAADVVDNGLSVSRNNVLKAQADVKEWTDLLSLEINAAVVRGGRWENLMNGAWKTISESAVG